MTETVQVVVVVVALVLLHLWAYYWRIYRPEHPDDTNDYGESCNIRGHAFRCQCRSDQVDGCVLGKKVR